MARRTQALQARGGHFYNERTIRRQRHQHRQTLPLGGLLLLAQCLLHHLSMAHEPLGVPFTHTISQKQLFVPVKTVCSKSTFTTTPVVLIAAPGSVPAARPQSNTNLY
jgi:hypothetical protein